MERADRRLIRSLNHWCETDVQCGGDGSGGMGEERIEEMLVERNQSVRPSCLGIGGL